MYPYPEWKTSKGADKVDYPEYNKGGKIVFRRFFSFTFIAPDDDDDCDDDADGTEQRTWEIHRLHGWCTGEMGDRQDAIEKLLNVSCGKENTKDIVAVLEINRQSC